MLRYDCEVHSKFKTYFRMFSNTSQLKLPLVRSKPCHVGSPNEFALDAKLINNVLDDGSLYSTGSIYELRD